VIGKPVNPPGIFVKARIGRLASALTAQQTLSHYGLFLPRRWVNSSRAR
jgi:hypothetical protein